jgi:hypothetical protein
LEEDELFGLVPVVADLADLVVVVLALLPEAHRFLLEVVLHNLHKLKQ